MHDGHPHGSCGDCVSFVEPFARTTRIEGWGYCREQLTEPPRQDVLETLADACRSGDRGPLRRNAAGLYRPEEDDCCDFYRERP